MTQENLLDLSETALADHLWKRLRRETLDPPLASRFGDEEPETIYIQAIRESGDDSFRRRLIAAMNDNFSRLALARIAAVDQPVDETTDEQLASLAFLASKIDATELTSALYNYIASWFITSGTPGLQPTFGQTHLIRALAALQKRDGMLASFWRSLWDSGLRSLRGLVIYGWARADPDAALQHLGELADSCDAIDLPLAFWSLLGPNGPGRISTFTAARGCSEEQKALLRQSLLEAGADGRVLQDFDFYAGHASPADAGAFPWDEGIPAPAQSQPLKWNV